MMFPVIISFCMLWHSPQESAKASTTAKSIFAIRMDSIEKKLDRLEAIADSIVKVKHGKRAKKN